MPLKLALFDCDGTLADSQHAVVAGMRDAFAACALPCPADGAIRTAIGLSLPRLIATLTPDADADQQSALVDAYREAYFAHRAAAGASPEPLYDGIAACLDTLSAQGWQLGIATGKSQRGLVRLLDAHGILDRFVTLQSADHHASKPDPAMVMAAMAQTLTAPAHTVVIGDTSFDMMMARSAGAHALGVGWGYHPVAELSAAGAHAIAQTPAAIPDALARLIGESA
ncbi:MAG: HAD-IA family hydrolase [Sphingopyxis sp.]